MWSLSLIQSVGRVTVWCGLTATTSGAMLSFSAFTAYVAQSYGNTQETVSSYSYRWSVCLALLAEILLLAGLVGLYKKQANEVGDLGALGFVATLYGIVSVNIVTWLTVTVTPTTNYFDYIANPREVLGILFWLSCVLLTVGWILFGLATCRANIYSTVPAVFLTAAAVFFPLSLPPALFVISFLPHEPLLVGHVVFDAALIWLSLELWYQPLFSLWRERKARP